MRRSTQRAFLFVLLPAVPLAGAAVIACGSDYGVNNGNQTDAAGADSATSNDGGGPADGTRGGHCYPNDTCNAGLTCAEGMCIVLIDTDSGAQEKDAAPIMCPAITNMGYGCFFSGGGPPAGIECIDPTGGAYNQTCSTFDAGCPTGKRINCLSPGDCNATIGPACCFNVQSLNDTDCTTMASIQNTVVSSCAKSCIGANNYAGCRSDADCEQGARCKTVTSNQPNDAGDSIFSICIF
jgi:hypothetical protein